MSDYDKAIFDQSVFDEKTEHIFKNKTILQAQDSNNSNYSTGYINISCRNLESSERYVDFNEAYLSIPFVIALKSSTDATAANVVNSFSAGLKNGHYQLINSMTVQYKGSTLVEQQFNINQFANFKVLSTWSNDTLTKYGTACGVCPDTEDSFVYNAAASGEGIGFGNNRVAATPGASLAVWGQNGVPSQINSGYLERLKTTPASLTNAGATPTSAFGKVNTDTNATNESMNVYKNDQGVGTARIYYWQILCMVRLKDVCPLFNKMPLVKATDFYFQIGINNLQSLTLTSALTAGPPTSSTYTLTSVSVLGNTNPVMFSSGSSQIGVLATNNFGLNPNASMPDASTITIASGIGKATISGTTVSHPITQCSLYVPAYVLTDEYESELLNNRVKTIDYDDVLSATFTGLTAGQSLNLQVQTSATNPKMLIVIPHVNSASNATISPITSPFDSSPATTCPFASIQNFQVQLGGQNLFNSAQSYDFQQFMDELVQSGVNGSVDSELSSGLISRKMWNSGYRYYVANLSRRDAVGDLSSKSIVVKGQNNTQLVIDFQTFTVIGKRITLDILTGSLEKIIG